MSKKKTVEPLLAFPPGPNPETHEDGSRIFEGTSGRSLIPGDRYGNLVVVEVKNRELTSDEAADLCPQYENAYWVSGSGTPIPEAEIRAREARWAAWEIKAAAEKAARAPLTIYETRREELTRFLFPRSYGPVAKIAAAARSEVASCLHAGTHYRLFSGSLLGYTVYLEQRISDGEPLPGSNWYAPLEFVRIVEEAERRRHHWALETLASFPPGVRTVISYGDEGLKIGCSYNWVEGLRKYLRRHDPGRLATEPEDVV